MVPPSLQIRFFDKKPSFKKDVKRLDQKVIDDLEKALGELQTELPPGRNLKKLQGTANIYSIRIAGITGCHSNLMAIKPFSGA